jgi:hypothetical protein
LRGERWDTSGHFNASDTTRAPSTFSPAALFIPVRLVRI